MFRVTVSAMGSKTYCSEATESAQRNAIIRSVSTTAETAFPLLAQSQ